jgi:CDP-glycerol glycerophosphotransferase (TagB/SpsB family)
MNQNDEHKKPTHKKPKVFLDFLTDKGNNRVEIEGYIENNPLPDIAKIHLKVNGRVYNLKPEERRQREKWRGNRLVDNGGAFSVNAKLEAHQKNIIRFVGESGDVKHELRLKTGQFTRLSPLACSYRRDKNWLFTKYPKTIVAKPYAKPRHALYEARFLARLLFNWQIRHAAGRLVIMRSEGKINSAASLIKEAIKSAGIVAEAIVMLPRAYLLRLCYYIAKRHKTRPIWLVSDRAVAAGDNGEALFRYICQREDCPADVYFVLLKKTKDFGALSKYGNVLSPASLTYKLKFLLADKIISSQANIETTNPFVRQINHFVDLYNFDFVFLQHGVIRHDLSTWLNRYNKNIRLFITTGKKEYDSILSNPYYYPKQNVLLSGQPRYDLLDNKPSRKLILSPTYRGNLLRLGTDKNGQRPYDPQFKNSQYRNFYNNLMNDPRITNELKKQNMTGEFYLHPVFAAQRPDFDENKRFKVMQFPYNYKKAISEGELLISDHSSIVFDFVYLKKPTVYAHFDIDTFFTGHSYDQSNFFSDEDDGFGKIYYDYDSLVEGVVKLLKNGQKMPAKYQRRVEDFFAYTDTHNSQRVYDAILNLDYATSKEQING